MMRVFQAAMVLPALGMIFGVPRACASLPKPGEAVSVGFIEPKLERQIRVRLQEKTTEVRLRGFDLEFSSGRVSSSGFLGSRNLVSRADRLTSWVARCHDGKVELLKDDERRVFDAVVWIESPSGFITVDTALRLRDTLQVRALPRSSSCELVNSVDVEKYLEGLVNSEFSSKWSRTAIDAQVVAARTYAYHQMSVARRSPATSFDVESTIKDQVYEGAHKEDARAAQSVARTRDLILTADGQRPIKAFYHSTCGGQTELPRFVWGREVAGFQRRVACAYCKVSPRYTWKLTPTSADFKERLLNARAELPEYVRKGELESLEIAERHPSGRASRVTSRWKWKGMSLRWDFTAVQMRAWMGLNTMRSTWFEIKRAGKRFEIAGRGFGHGVGMCQWGAKVMGEKGRRMDEILRQYYPDAQLARLSSSAGRSLAAQ